MEKFNIEIKAKIEDIEQYRKALLNLGAKFYGTDCQVDTYFNVPNGRLKIREGNIENALIYYQRKNQRAPKASEVILFNLSEDRTLKSILTQALGIKVIVSKIREIYYLENIKIHLDKVENLGTFLEIEAIGQSKAEHLSLLNQLQNLMKELKIDPSHLVSESYSDMLLKISSS